MKEIDWSKAPHGTTHFRQDDPKSPWRMLKDGVWHAWFGGEWMTVTTAAEHFYIARPAWSGEGLPPVGAMVEIRLMGWSIRESAEKFIGIPLRVAASFRMDCGTDMIAVDGGHDLGCEVFRAEMAVPARTPEQIAAEEREKAIDQMMVDYEFTVGSCTHQLFRHQAERLHDAGYRKVTP